MGIVLPQTLIAHSNNPLDIFFYKMSRIQSKRWCLTSYNEAVISELPQFALYIIGQQEICPTSGRLHWQIYFETEGKRGPKAVIKDLQLFYGNHDFHLEATKGTQQQNIDYVSKEESAIPNTHFFFGVKQAQGKRTDIQSLALLIQSGASDMDIVLENPAFLRFDRFIGKLRNVYNRELSRQIRTIEVTYIWGPPGTGKSHLAYEMMQKNNMDFFQPSPPKNGELWFTDYTREKILWIEEFSNDINRALLLRITDKYPLTIDTKGGHTYALWTHVVITANIDPTRLEDALQRRLSTVIHKEHVFTVDPPEAE